MGRITTSIGKTALALAALGSAGLLAAPGARAAGFEAEIECRAGRERAVELEASHEVWERAGRTLREFEVDLEIEGGRGYAVGQVVTFRVAGTVVGTSKLSRDGDLNASLDFESWRATGPRRFPAAFPEGRPRDRGRGRHRRQGRAGLQAALRRPVACRGRPSGAATGRPGSAKKPPSPPCRPARPPQISA